MCVSAEQDRLIEGQTAGLSSLYLAVDGELVGVLAIADPIKPSVPAAIASLRELGFSHIVMLTGDNEVAAARIAALVGLRRLSCELMDRMSTTFAQVIGFNSALLALGIAGVITPQTSSLLHNSSTVLFSMRDSRSFDM